jgi:2-keto-3-deoxygluconate permease
LLGIFTAVLVVVITGIPLILADIFLGGGRGTAGIAASSTAGAAVATPVLIANVSPQFAAVAPAATSLVAASVVITAIVVPIITGLWAKRVAPKIRPEMKV